MYLQEWSQDIKLNYPNLVSDLHTDSKYAKVKKVSIGILPLDIPLAKCLNCHKQSISVFLLQK